MDLYEGWPRKRYLRAHGRDIDYPERLVTFDSETLALTVGEGDRKSNRTDEAISRIVSVVKRIA